MSIVRSLLFVTLAFAAFPSAFAGDPVAGKAKAALCAACHGAAGISAVGIWPNLAGQKEKYLNMQLRAFRSGARKAPTMLPFVQGLSDADIANLAAYYSSLSACP